MSTPMTAAGHFLAGEELLAQAARPSTTEPARVTKIAFANAHFRAAEILLQAEALRNHHPDDLLARTGMGAVIRSRADSVR